MGFKRGGRTNTGSSSTLDFAFYSFAGGLNIKGAPQLIGDEDLTIATNGYLRPDGAFQMRNGMATYGSVITTGSATTFGTRYYQGIQNGAAVVPNTLSLLAVFKGVLYSVPASGAATSLGSVGGSNVVNVTFTQMQDPNDPHFASGLTDVMVICTGVGGPYVWDGTNLYTPTGWALASGAQWCAIVNGITWFGGINAYPNQIFGTGDGIIASMETLPAYRNFVFSTPVVGLCPQGAGATANLIIGLNLGVGILYGTGPSTFFLQEVPFEDGVTAGRTMLYDNGVIYFLGANAVYSFDGQSSPRRISDKIEPWILNDPLVPGYAMTQNRQLSFSTIYRNRYYLGYCSGATTPNVFLVFDLVVGGWTIVIPTPGIGSMWLLDAPSDTVPAVCLVGSSASGQIYTWDYISTTSGVALDGTTPVIAQVQSKYFKLGDPGSNKMLMRFYPEFQVAGFFNAGFLMSTNYGMTTTTTTTTTPGVVFTTGIWDTSLWDQCLWDGAFSAFTFFGSPSSRIDYPGTQADAFAFGVQMNQALAPWYWSGGSGEFKQGAKT